MLCVFIVHIFKPCVRKLNLITNTILQNDNALNPIWASFMQLTFSFKHNSIVGSSLDSTIHKWIFQSLNGVGYGSSHKKEWKHT